jgi:hypothetical protein
VITKRYAWHYTTGEKFELIVSSGVLMPSSSGIWLGERPINWFSTNQYWELTANKALHQENGDERLLSMRETFLEASGLVRFGIEARKLTLWPTVGRKAGMRQEIIDGLEVYGRRVGANPSEWCGTKRTIAVDDLIVQAMDEKFQWKRPEELVEDAA